MLTLLPVPEIQIVSVCDPNKDAVGISRLVQRGPAQPDPPHARRSPTGRPGREGAIPGGRDAAKNIVETYYAKTSARGDSFKGCSSYADYRELLDKEKDLNAVKIMTPDHLHAVISHRRHEAGQARHHAQADRQPAEGSPTGDRYGAQDGRGHALHAVGRQRIMEPVMAWIRDGAIGTLREVHNWTNRPVWPQYATLPTDTPPVPEGFDWNLWLGPEAERPYHPNYTHMVFRGWYDFGGGSMADMGHYSLWTVFNALELSRPPASSRC